MQELFNDWYHISGWQDSNGIGRQSRTFNGTLPIDLFGQNHMDIIVSFPHHEQHMYFYNVFEALDSLQIDLRNSNINYIVSLKRNLLCDATFDSKRTHRKSNI